MRQILNTVIALAVVAAGAASMGYLLFGAAGYKGWMVIASGFVFIAGLVWLYADMTDPPLNKDDG
jgi:hypothetical protein